MPINQDKKKIIIFGGSFSPPHIGHATVIEAVLRLVTCDEVWIMPSADRRDKKISADGHHRSEMCHLMVEELFPTTKIPIRISKEELDRPELTTTCTTKLELEKKHPDSEFHFVIGADLVKDIRSFWVDGEKLWETANFVIIKGPCHDLSTDLPPSSTIIKDFGWLSVSSTFVRGLISQGHSGIPYISRGVSDYIQKHGLYYKP